MKYVISDVHGDYERYSVMKVKINLKPNDKLIILGDAIDRGKDGIRIIKDVMENDNIILMAGNHEMMMFESDLLDKGNITVKEDLDEVRRNWIDTNGGYYTMKALFDLPESERENIINYITELVLTSPFRKVKCDNGCIYGLCHGWPNDSRKVGNDPTSLYAYIFHSVWDRPKRRNDVPHDIQDVLYEERVRQIIIGHTPVANLMTNNEIKNCGDHFKILHTPGYIDIDCGCGHGSMGCLGCLCLDTMEEFYVE